MGRPLTIKTKIYAIAFTLALAAAIITNYYRYWRDHQKLTTKPIPGATSNDYVQVFTHIYKEHYWSNGSGPGSMPRNAVQYIELLQQYFDDPRFKTIVDLGCGDWQFMRLINIPTDKSYVGYDVVSSLVTTNTAAFSKDNIHFYQISNLQDFAAQKVGGDLLIVKDVLQHWPHSEIEYFIANILPNFKYALITNEYIPDSKMHNQDISMGGWRSLSLLDEPYNLPNTTQVLEYEYYDGKPQFNKQVLLYVNPHMA